MFILLALDFLSRLIVFLLAIFTGAFSMSRILESRLSDKSKLILGPATAIIFYLGTIALVFWLFW